MAQSDFLLQRRALGTVCEKFAVKRDKYKYQSKENNFLKNVKTTREVSSLEKQERKKKQFIISSGTVVLFSSNFQIYNYTFPPQSWQIQEIIQEESCVEE